LLEDVGSKVLPDLLDTINGFGSDLPSMDKVRIVLIQIDLLLISMGGLGQHGFSFLSFETGMNGCS